MEADKEVRVRVMRASTTSGLGNMPLYFSCSVLAEKLMIWFHHILYPVHQQSVPLEMEIN